MSDKFNRKDFLKRFSIVGLAAVTAGPLLKACGNGEQEVADDAVDPCADLSGVPEDQRALRDTFQYVSETEIPEQRCDNCIFWKEPEGGSPCGGCELMAGPFHPGGWCNAWQPMEG